MIFAFSTILKKVNSSSGWNYHLIVPKAISTEIRKKKSDAVHYQRPSRFFLRFVSGRGRHIITVNKTSRAMLGIDAGDDLDVKLTEDPSKYGMPVPAVFEELLLQGE